MLTKFETKSARVKGESTFPYVVREYSVPGIETSALIVVVLSVLRVQTLAREIATLHFDILLI